MERQYYVYMMTNKWHTVEYTGVTGNLPARVEQHKLKLLPGFTKSYNATKLVFYEAFGDFMLAIEREKQIKGGSRRRKADLITSMNPDWKDLSGELD